MCANAKFDRLDDMFEQLLDHLGGAYELCTLPNRNELLANIAAICAAAAEVSRDALAQIETP